MRLARATRFNHINPHRIMTRQLIVMVASALTGLMIACGGKDAENKSAQSAAVETDAVADDKEADGRVLVADEVAAPAGFTFERKDLEGIGTIDLPTGKDWTNEGNTYYNESLDMTVNIQSQAANNLDVVEDYTQSYVDNNHRDAQAYKETNRDIGQVNGYVAAMVAGTFNNGQPYVTKDYLFFTPEKTVVLQARVNENDKDKLEALVDHMASSLKK